MAFIARQRAETFYVWYYLISIVLFMLATKFSAKQLCTAVLTCAGLYCMKNFTVFLSGEMFGDLSLFHLFAICSTIHITSGISVLIIGISNSTICIITFFWGEINRIKDLNRLTVRPSVRAFYYSFYNCTTAVAKLNKIVITYQKFIN